MSYIPTLKADHYDMQICQGLAGTKENLHEEELRVCR